MIYLLLSVLSSGSILILFKFLARYEFPLLYPIVINYFVAFLIGLIFTPPHLDVFSSNVSYLIPAALWLGSLFILMFFFIGKSSQKAGIFVTSVASRMSLIFPISFAILFYEEKLSVFKLSGIILALLSVILTSLKVRTQRADWKYLYLPLVVFVGSGLIDSSVEFSQHSLLQENTQSAFTILVFMIAALFGLSFSILKKYDFKKILKKEIFWSGLILGTLNYASLYFMISALKSTRFDDSVIFGFNNIGVVLFSVLIGIIFYHEKISKLNIVGIFLSLLAVYFLSLHVN